MNRKSPVWLIGVLLVVTGLGFAGSMVRYRPCISCDGLALYLNQVHPRRPVELLPRVDCPDCGDRGKVSLFKSWMRPKVADSVAAILRGLSAPVHGVSHLALKDLLLENGKSLSEFQGLSIGNEFTCARFMEVEGKTVLLLILDTSSSANPATAIMLVSPDGRLLDYVQVSGSNGEVDVRAAFLEKPGEEGAQLAILPRRGFFAPGQGVELRLDFRVDQWTRPPRQFAFTWKGSEAELICPLRIRGGRLECLR